MKSYDGSRMVSSLFLISIMLLLASYAAAPTFSAPALINYQGKIDVNLQPFTGAGLFRFALVNASGTTQYWSNDGAQPPAADVSITVNNGLYNVVLGQGMQALEPTVFQQFDELYLRVWFNDNVNGLQQLSPDQRLAAVSYALSASEAQTLQGYTPADFAAAGHNHDAAYINDNAGEINVAADFNFPASTFIANLDSDKLDGQHAAAFSLATHNHDAAYINDNAGEINAAADFNFTASTFITNLDADKLDGQHASAFSLTTHNHDAAYINDGAGEINAAADFNFPASTFIANLDADKLDGYDWATVPEAIDKWVNETGDTMTGTLNLPANGLVVGANQLVVSGGYVGIGVTPPTAALDVNGTAKMTGFQLGTSATAGQVLTAAANGVGTWQTLPAEPWTASGDTIYYEGPVSVGTDMTVGGVFNVYGASGAIDQQNNTQNGSVHGYGGYWQSFTAGVAGSLIGVHLYLSGYGVEAWHGTFRIYAGEGTGGAILAEQAYQGYGSSAAFRLFKLDQPVTLVAGSQYTIYLYAPSGSSIVWTKSSANPYAGGRADWGVDQDYRFITYMLDAENRPGLIVEPATLRVGIGRYTVDYPLQVGTDTTNGNGAYLTEGGVWTNGSDRNAKTGFTPVDSRAILDKLANLPVTSWQFKGEADSVRHIGPVAQDFYETFGLGNDDTHIGTLDADGVALAAIQGLKLEQDEKALELEQLRTQLQSQLAEKDDRIAELEKRLERLEKMLQR